MRSVVLFLFCLITSIVACFPQQTINLTFTAIDSASYVQLDSIKVLNRTQECDTVLYWNDTVLVMNAPVGLPEINSRRKGFEIRSYPNPVTDHATIELKLPDPGKTTMTVSDLLGRYLYSQERDLQAGSHAFQFLPGMARLYFVTATWNGYQKSIKVVNSSRSIGLQCTISYQGNDDVDAQLKATGSRSGFTFELGDELLYIGYADTLESGILDLTDTSQTYSFQFAYNIPCLGMPTVTYEGKVYNTVQIFNQCWLKENLDVGIMIPGDSNMEDNGVNEKYCYNNEPDSCAKYGGLYQWEEMMLYDSIPGIQGICPPGWHIPTDDEWKVLEGSVDSQYGVGDTIWDEKYMRGYDAGTNLKAASGWYNNHNGTDLYGFSGLPGGRRWWSILFADIGYYIGLWTSSGGRTEPLPHAWKRAFYSHQHGVEREDVFHIDGNSVRCVKD